MKQFHSHTRFELSFLDMLEEALTEIGIFGNRQYCVDQYKLDFYIEELKLTIEYDEDHHSSKIDEDTKRQEYIMKKLGCIFIRCNYKDSDIKNVMKVYVLYMSIDGVIDILGIFSTKEKAEKELMDYNIIMMVDFGLKIKEVEMDKIISF